MHRTQKLFGFLRDADSQGIDVSDILATIKLTPAELNGGHHLISAAQLRGALEALSNRVPPDFALVHGGKTKQLDMGVVGHAILSCQTIKQVIDIWVKFSEAIGHPLKFESKILDGYWVLDMQPNVILPENARRFILDDAIACFTPLVREVTNEHFSPVQFELAEKKPKTMAHYEQWIPAPVKFGCQHNRIITKKKALMMPLSTADAEVLMMCDQHCSTILKSIKDTDSVAQQVKENLLIKRGCIPSITEVAKNMGVSKRTLNRRLVEEGYTYQRLVTDFRKDYVFELLKEGVLQGKEVAYALGFKDVSSFRRVFKEWTGQTVSQWLKSNTNKIE